MRLYRVTLSILFLTSLLASPIPVQAAEDDELDALGHTADGNYLDFLPLAKIELPRLLLVRNADGSLGFDVFGSTSAALLSPFYRASTLNPDLVNLTEDALIARGQHYYVGLERTEGSVLIDFSITRHLVFAFITAILLMVIFISLANRYKRGVGATSAPKGRWQNMLESVILFIRDEIARPNIGPKYARFMPYLLTVFFFILVSNLWGMVPWGATATANLTVTAALAICTFLITQFAGSRDYWQHILWPPGMPVFVKLILIPVEIMGMISKPIALAIRLFAVMTAGHMVILSLIGLIFTFAVIFGALWGFVVSPVSVAMALFVALLELLIAIIQAYIFTILSALFIGMAAAEHAHHEEHGAHPEAHRKHDVVATTGVVDDETQENVIREPAVAH